MYDLVPVGKKDLLQELKDIMFAIGKNEPIPGEDTEQDIKVTQVADIPTNHKTNVSVNQIAHIANYRVTFHVFEALEKLERLEKIIDGNRDEIEVTPEFTLPGNNVDIDQLLRDNVSLESAMKFFKRQYLLAATVGCKKQAQLADKIGIASSSIGDCLKSCDLDWTNVKNYTG